MMNHPSLRGIPRSGDLGEKALLTEVQYQRPSGFWRRLWHGWLWLTGPRPERFGMDLTGQENLRRSQMVSVLLVLVVAAICVLIPDVFIQPHLIVSLLVDIGLGLLAAVLNRAGKITLAGLICILLVDLGVTAAILNSPTGLNSLAPSIFSLYLIAVLDAGVVLSRPWIVAIGVVQMGLILALFTLVPPDASLILLIKSDYNGQGYPILVPAILLIMCTTAIVWLYSAGVERALMRASRAEELAEARARIHEQARQITEQNQRLEQGIVMLQEVHARLANGDYMARVNLQGNELLPLGVSLNLLAERLSRSGRVQQDYQRLEEAIQQLVRSCAALTQGAFPVALPPTGTSVDQLTAFLAWVQQLVSHLAQGSAMADDLQTVLQYQEGCLAQAESSLFNLRSLVNSGISAAAEHRPFSRSGPMGDGATQEQQDSTLRAMLEQGHALCEQLTQECTQAHQLGRRCVQGTRLLTLQLKEALRSKPAGGRASGSL